jgi:hypothetical protein
MWKMKLVKLAHPSQVREIPEHDLDRYLAQGWCELGKPVSRVAIRQRQFRRKRKLIGHKRFTAYLPPELFKLLDLQRLEGEGNAELLTRLLLQACEQQPQLESHK